jgi:hypothetical protein
MNVLGLMVLVLSSFNLLANCNDSVVLVHGNGGNASDWNNTYNELLARGYSSSEIYRPNWGSACVACNNHSGSEEVPVGNALLDAYQNSCTGQVDVIGHSMGVTLAIKQIIDLGLASDVDDFVGIAGAVRGLKSCGYYPYNVWSSTCGYWGLSINSPFLNSINNQFFANQVYSIKSWYDQIVCAGGCTVNGVHSSSIWAEDASFNYYLGHFGLQSDTAIQQVDLIQ